MKQVFQRGMKCFCCIMLTVTLATTGVLPVSAAGTKDAQNQKRKTAYGLQAGDILQPGDELAYEDWQTRLFVYYYDYQDDGNIKWFAENAIITESLVSPKPIKIKEYGTQKAGSLKLNKGQFDGWMVVSKGIECGFHGMEMLYLMAVPADAPTTVTCMAEISGDQTDASLKKEAAVTFYGFDKRTGKPLEGFGTSKLTATPGDVVYAVTNPVESYVSKLSVKARKNGWLTDLEDYLDLVYWKDKDGELYHEKCRLNPHGYTMSLTREVNVTGDMTYLPEESDAVTAFVVPHTDINVKAQYTKTSKKVELSFFPGWLGAPWDKEANINEKIVFPMLSREEANGQDILCWMTSNPPVGTEYYLPGESYYIDGTATKFSGIVQSEYDAKITIGDGCPAITTYYSNNVRGLRAPLVKTDSIVPYQLDEKCNAVSIKVDPKTIPDGYSLMGLRINTEEENSDSDFKYDPWKYYREYPSQVITGDSNITANYSKRRPDITIDMSNGYAAYGTDSGIVPISGKEALSSEGVGSDQDEVWYEFLYYYFCKSHDLTLNRTMRINWSLCQYNVITPYSVMLDLNGDEKWDIMATKMLAWNDVDDYVSKVQFDRLYGAEYCEKNSYDIIVNEASYGKFTLKLFDSCSVEYISDGKTAYKQETRVGLPLKKAADAVSGLKRDGYFFRGWSTAPDGSVPYDFNSAVEGDLKLYAIWEEDLTRPQGSNSEADLKDAEFGHLFARTKKVTKNSITLKWKKLPDAAGYIIFGGQCNNNGKKYAYEYLATVDASKSSWTHKGLKKDKYYKYYVLAFRETNGIKAKICASKTVHATTVSPRYGAAQKIKLNKKNVKLAKGKSFKIKAKEVNTSKKIQVHRKIGYETSDAKVAKVDKKGKIKAVGKGKCKVWVFAQNGKYATINVTVK